MKNKPTPGHDYRNKGDYFECTICKKKETDWMVVVQNTLAYMDGQRLCKKK